MSKLKISFELKSVKSENKPIIVVANFGYKKVDPYSGKVKYENLRYYSGISVSNSQWNSILKIPKDDSVLDTLNEIKSVIRKEYLSLLEKEQLITPKILKERTKIVLDNKNESINSMDSLNINVASFIEQSTLKRTSDFSPGRLRHFSSLRNKIRRFEKETKRSFDTSSLNEKMYLDFIEYCKRSLNTSNSVWSKHKDLKAVLNQIRREYKIEFYNPIDLDHMNKPKQSMNSKPYFSLDEMELISKYDPKTEKLKNVHFILCILLYTGCRYSDVFKIKPEDTFDKDGIRFKYAHFITQKKPKTEVILPILGPLESLFDKYGAPKKISDVKFNKYVKELIKEIGLDRNLKLAYTDENGDKQFEFSNLVESTSSHIGRRSFITNLIHLVPVTILTKITAHKLKDTSVIFTYNKVTPLDNAVLFVQELKRLHKEKRLKVKLI